MTLSMKCKKCKSDCWQKISNFPSGKSCQPRSAACKVLMTGKRLNTNNENELIFLTIMMDIYVTTPWPLLGGDDSSSVRIRVENYHERNELSYLGGEQRRCWSWSCLTVSSRKRKKSPESPELGSAFFPQLTGDSPPLQSYQR